LPTAIARGDLLIYFQPKVKLPERSVYGFEALVRWHRSGKVVPPDEFINVAEESGLIVELDRFVLMQGTKLLAEYNRSRNEIYAISVNLSAVHFSTNRIFSWVKEALSASGLSPELLTLEITETVEMRDWRQAQNVILKLRSLGVRIAIDDFGTGYSSLGYLRSTAADELKIDKSLVEEIETSSKARFLMDGVLDMAHNLQLDVVVEGIETTEQEQAVFEMGALQAQGFLYGRAVPAEQALRKLSLATANSA
jgi:EAL domain-containing protein (putative c-di-GMP-specific phosphodiesterase class I)